MWLWFGREVGGQRRSNNRRTMKGLVANKTTLKTNSCDAFIFYWLEELTNVDFLC